jgi:hypothetical protein
VNILGRSEFEKKGVWEEYRIREARGLGRAVEGDENVRERSVCSRLRQGSWEEEEWVRDKLLYKGPFKG